MVDTFASVNGRRIGYTDVGAGPAVLLLHGDTLDRRAWSPILDDLARDHRVIAPDTRGHGQSPDTRGPFSYEAFADDWRVLIDELALDDVAVVGHSGGGCTALMMGLEYPGRIRGMVLAGTPYNVSNYHDDVRASFEHAEFEQYLSWAGEWAEPAIAAYGDAAAYRRFWSRMFHDLFPREPNLTARDLRRIAPRSLVLHAEHEEAFARERSEELAAMLPDADLIVVPGATHMTLFSHDPAFVLARIRPFLAALPGAAATA